MNRFREYTSLNVGGRLDQIEIDRFLPVIDHPSFQRLHHRTQNGLSNTTYRGLRHTRGDHSLGAAELTDKVTQELIKRREVSEKQAYDLRLYALVHDLGHPPFCHAMELLLVDIAHNTSDLPSGHKQHTEALYRSSELDAYGRTMMECVASSRGDPDNILTLLNHQNAIHKIVSEKVIGTEKLDYMTRDAQNAAFSNTDLVLLTKNLRFLKDIYGIEEKHEQLIPPLMSLYVNLYDRVYFHKRGLAMERVLQKATEWAINSGELDPRMIWNMVDSDIDVALRTSNNKDVALLGNRILNNSKYGTGIGIIPGVPGTVTRNDHKNQVLVAVSLEQYQALVSQQLTPLRSTLIEQDIAEHLKIGPTDIVIAAVPRPDKMLPSDVQIFDKEGQPSSTIFKKYPHFQDHLRTVAQSAGIIRVYGHEPSGVRALIAHHAEEIAELIEEKLAT